VKNKICIIQLADKKYYEDRKGCVRSVSNYCNKMGYEWRGLVGTLDKSTHVAFQKPLSILKEIDSFQYVGWMDMDIAIANRSFDLQGYLIDKNQDVLICRDPAYFSNQTANSGVVFFKNSDLSRQILNEWWDNRIIGTDKHWRHQAGNGDADQQYLNEVLKKYSIPIQNPHDLNIYPKNYKKGDFAIHFMGHHPIDFEKFVSFADLNIKDQSTLEAFWMVYSFQSFNRIDRIYEYTSSNNEEIRFSPENILYHAEQLKDMNVPH
jgi:hypothetical protein